MPVIDTNTNCTDADKIMTLLDRGVTAVGRYYGVVNPEYKITEPEATALSKAKIKIFAIYEDTGHYLPLTEERGETDGGHAFNQANKIGQPQNTPIYFTLEGLHLPLGYTKDDLPGIRDYFRGVKTSLKGKYLTGVYSDGVVCSHMLSEHACLHTYVSASMDFVGTREFVASNLWNIWQQVPTDQDWDGISVDVDLTRGDFGAFLVPTT